MATWQKKKFFRLAKGFTRKGSNCYRVMIRKVFRKLQYQFRDRRNKKRVMRRNWIQNINAASREHGLPYSRFAHALHHSSVNLNRKILADLAQNEPYSFKAVFDELRSQSRVELSLPEAANAAPRMSFDAALEQGLLARRKPENYADPGEVPLRFWGLRFPERDAKTERDYMRVSFEEEDRAWRKDRESRMLTRKEMKKIKNTVTEDDFEHDESFFEKQDFRPS